MKVKFGCPTCGSEFTFGEMLEHRRRARKATTKAYGIVPLAEQQAEAAAQELEVVA